MQMGLEYEAAERFFSRWFGEAGWYGALDVTASKERNWAVSRSLQFGLILPRNGHNWRLAIEYYAGRALLGEFFQNDERYLSAGVWLDM